MGQVYIAVGEGAKHCVDNPLEPHTRRRFLSAVIAERVWRGVQSGVVAAAATCGVLLGFGRARHATWMPVNAIAHMVVGDRAIRVEHFDAAVTATGLCVHVISLILWGVIFALLAWRLRGWRLFAASCAFAAAAYVVDYYVMPARLTPGFEAVISPAERIAVYAVFAVALAVGLGAATSDGVSERRA